VGSVRMRAMIQGLQSWFMFRGANPVTATRRAYDAVWGLLQQQAAMLSFNQVFWLLGLLFLLMLPLVFLMRRPSAHRQIAAH